MLRRGAGAAAHEGDAVVVSGPSLRAQACRLDSGVERMCSVLHEGDARVLATPALLPGRPARLSISIPILHSRCTGHEVMRPFFLGSISVCQGKYIPQRPQSGTVVTATLQMYPLTCQRDAHMTWCKCA